MKLLITTSTLPVSENDKVPAFVRDQAVALKQLDPALKILLHAPHNAYSPTASTGERDPSYDVYRYHYFWPFLWERLTGRGIMPALKSNPFLYFQIPFLFLFQFLSLLSLVRREKPDLLYAHWFTPQAITTAWVSRFTGVPFIFTTHASDVSVLSRLPGCEKLVCRICRQAKFYTAVSQRTADRLTRFFARAHDRQNLEQKLFIIPMGISTGMPDVNETDSAKVFDRFRIPRDKIRILFLGRLAEKKGAGDLLEAIAGLHNAARCRVHLVIAGDGQLRERLESQSRRLGLTNVTFTGYVTGIEKRALIKVADLACFPSIIDSAGDAEGFPVSIMECLAAGKIILSSNVTGAEDVIVTNEAGFVFPEKSPAELASLIEHVLDLDPDTRTRLQRNAEILAAEYDWQGISKQHYQLFQKCLDHGI